MLNFIGAKERQQKTAFPICQTQKSGRGESGVFCAFAKAKKERNLSVPLLRLLAPCLVEFLGQLGDAGD